MYNSQYYTCEQIDERLLQGYVDDYNTKHSTSLTKDQFLTLLGSLFNKEFIVQQKGQNTNLTMSQKALTDILDPMLTKINSQDVIVVPGDDGRYDTKIVDSITDGSGYTRNIKFKSNSIIISGNPSADINDYNFIRPISVDSNGYDIPNAACLYFNRKTRSFGTHSANSVNEFNPVVSDINNVVLIFNLYGRLYSPISTLQFELDRLQYPNINYRTLLLGTSIVCLSGSDGENKNVIKSITPGSSLSNNIKFNGSITITGNSEILGSGADANTYRSIETDETNGYDIPNSAYLVLDVKSKTLSVISNAGAANFVSTLWDEHKIVLFYNLWGGLYSPIATLQAELYEHYNQHASKATVDNLLNISQLWDYRSKLCPNLAILRSGQNYGKVIKEISTSGLSNIVKFTEENFVIVGNTDTNINSYTYVGGFTIDSNGYTVANSSCLYVDLKNKTINTAYASTVNDFNPIASDKNKVVLLFNLWGRLYSPIATLQAELYEYYNPGFITQETANFLLYRAKLNPSIVLIKQGENYGNVIKEITNDYLTCNVKLENFVITGNTDSTFKQYSYVNYDEGIDENGYNIPNSSCLYLDLKNHTINVASISLASGFNTIIQNVNNVVILFNLWGRLYSPVTTLQAELYDHYKPAPTPPTVTVITVDASGNGDFTSVRDAVSYITDASANKPYKIFVKNGTYNEIDIHTKDYVDIEGESKDGVILYCDGTRTDNSPADYNWRPEDYANVPINTIPKAWKHLFIHMSNSTISNMTLKVNMCKYVIHQDNEGQAYEAITKNCILIREELYSDNGSSDYDQGLQYIVGIGARGYQFQRYYNCEFITNTKGLPETRYNGSIIWHNWNGTIGAKKAGATFKDCNCFGVKHIAEVCNLKSYGEDDEVIFDNVVADTPKANNILIYTNDYYDEHSIDRMCITVPINNCYKLDSIILGYGSNMLKQCINANVFTKKYSTIALLKGQPVDIENGVSIATAAPFAVVAEGISANEFVFVSTGHTFMGLCVSGTYAIGDEVYISNGKFTKTQTGNAVGKAIEAKTLSADGEVMIEKY